MAQPGPPSFCCGCDEQFYNLSTKDCALCRDVDREIRAGVDRSAALDFARMVREKKQQCLSCSLFWKTSTVPKLLCRPCIALWTAPGVLLPPEVTKLLAEMGQRPSQVHPVPEPAGLKTSRADGETSGRSSELYGGNSLANSANTHSEAASSAGRLGKPTTTTTSRFLSGNAKEVKGPRTLEKRNFQKASTVDKISINVTVWREQSAKVKPKRLSNVQIRLAWHPTASILFSMDELVASIQREHAKEEISQDALRYEVEQSSKVHPEINSYLDRYGAHTTVEQFWKDLLDHALVKDSAKTCNIRAIVLAHYVESGSDEELTTSVSPTSRRLPPIAEDKMPVQGTISETRKGSVFAPGSLNHPSILTGGTSRVFTMSAFRPPTRPPPTLPQTYQEYERELTLIPYQIFVNYWARAETDGTIVIGCLGTTQFNISNVLQKMNWDENPKLEPGKGIIGVGASKVTIFANGDGGDWGGNFALSVYIPSTLSPLTPELQEADLKAELKLLTLLSYFVPGFEEALAEAQKKEKFVEAPPAFRIVSRQSSFVGKIDGRVEEDNGLPLINNLDLSILPQSHFLATPLAGKPGAEVLHFTANNPVNNPSGPPVSINPIETSYDGYWNLVIAFSHYVFEASKHTMVLVDIQGVIEDNVLVIFDPQAHTNFELPEGEARPFWDGGLEKIEVWVKLHICNHYCRALDLPQLPPPTQNEADSNKDISEPSGSGLKKQQAKPQKKGQKRKTSPSAQVERPVTRSTTGSTPNR